MILYFIQKYYLTRGKNTTCFLNNKNEYLRRFCDPKIIYKDVMIYYITKYAEELKQYYRRYIYLRGNEQDVNLFR